jgi:hypothetical protein
MKHVLLKSAAVFVLLTLCSLLAFGQTTATGSLSGTVIDPTGAAVAGAAVSVKNNATAQELTATTNDQGTFNVPAVPSGSYTVTITPTTGFKQSILKDVKVDAGRPSNVDVKLEVGQVTESVTITGAGGELINSTNANVSTTITGRQITDLPFASRNALDLILLLPGSQTPGRPRTSTVNGLPKGALNITLDGINVQDNLLKSNDGFFTYIQPKTDAIEEVTLSTATPGAESSGQGAVQIKFTTRSGGNEFHGSLYEYHRNPSLNSNYYFNNETLPPDPVDHTAPRNRVLLNQYGGRVGGPISIPHLFSGHDKAFFFVNYEEYRLPERSLRTRTVLDPTTATGVFQYLVNGQLRTVNLFTLAAANGLTSTPDPTISALLPAIRTAVTGNGGGITPLSDPNLQRAAFINPGGQVRYFPTVRFDYNLTQKHHLSNVWNYQDFNSNVDFLNNADPAFPGFPNHGSQASNRFSNAMTHRWTVTQNIVNEANFGITGGTVVFFPETNVAQFANQNGVNLNNGFAAAGVSGLTTVNAPQRRNSPVKQFSDNLTWVKGTHTATFGGDFTRIGLFSQIATGGIIPSVTFGLGPATGSNTDPAQAVFQVGSNFPGASQAQVTAAAGIYAFLTGRTTSVTNTEVINESSGSLAPFGDLIQRAHQQEFGIFAQDSWRFRPNLTISYGLREEMQFAPIAENNGFSQVNGGFAGLFGVSGDYNHLFVPGVVAPVTTFTALPPGSKAYNTDKLNLAPSIGFAWSPDWKSGVLGRMFGSGGKSVFRGGFSMAYTREGTNILLSVLGSNPGATLDNRRNTTSTGANLLPSGSLFRNPATLAFAPGPLTPAFPITASALNASNSANAFDPHLRLGYAESFTFGWQREITKDTVFEARYVGTRGHLLQHQYNINEINVLSNGFANEYKLALQNLQSNIANGRGTNFRYFGPGTGTSPLPIIFALFNNQPGANASNCTSVATCTTLYSNSLFANSTFLNTMQFQNPSAFGFANVFISNPATFLGNFNSTTGIPTNFFLINPDVRAGGSFIVDNTGASWYDGATFEVRRRMARGLLVQGSYTFAKSQSLGFSSSSVLAWNATSQRNRYLDKTSAPFDIRHAIKADFIYELPFGKGKKWLDGVGGFLNGFVGGWSLNGTVRTQSGTAFDLGAVQLVGMNAKDLQHAVEIRKDPNHIVYFLPQDIIDNTIRAFSLTQTGFSGTAPTGRFIAPVGFGGCVQSTPGSCGFSHLVLHGPRFNRVDMSVVKKVKFTETKNLELRAEFLNLPNAINFIVGNAANDVNTVTNFSSAAFGQTGSAYQDLSTTNDPGGRLIQLVLRINF